MTMPFLEVKNSGPDVPDGAYPMILIAIEGDPENPDLPKHIVPDKGQFKDQDFYRWDWVFRINIPGDNPLNATEPFKYGTSTATGPKSKMYGVLTALLNGSRPAVGMTFEKNDLIGRQVYATVQKSEAGYCDIVSFSPVPAHLQQAGFAAATGAPTQGTPVAATPTVAPAPAPVAAAPPAEVPGTALPNQVPGQFTPGQIVPPMPAPAQRPPDDLPF